MRQTEFDQGGTHGLQSYCAHAIESYLRLIVRKKYGGVAASEIAAEGLGFVKGWGSRQVRWWAQVWMNHQELLQSERGCHIKVKTLLEDPAIKMELQTFMWSNKWSMNPKKLQECTNNTLKGLSFGNMDRYMPTSGLHEVHKSFYGYEKKIITRLDRKVTSKLFNMFSNLRIRMLSARGINPEDYKEVTLILDGHDTNEIGRASCRERV